MAEELLEAEAIEEPDAAGEAIEEAEVRALPERPRSRELAAATDVRAAALAAAGGIVAGAATVAAVRAIGSGAARAGRSRRALRKREQRPVNVIASRSFLVDIHLLGK
jgi:hypothetical protein